MQKEKTKVQEIAVRLYENAKYGTTYSKGLRHSAVFNAAADLREPNTKYLLDLYKLEDWQNTARSDADMETMKFVSETANADTLASWVVRYDRNTKAKQRVIGYCTLNLRNNALDLFVYDEQTGVMNRWQLTAKPCRAVAGKNSPSLLATNAELGSWE